MVTACYCTRAWPQWLYADHHCTHSHTTQQFIDPWWGVCAGKVARRRGCSSCAVSRPSSRMSSSPSPPASTLPAAIWPCTWPAGWPTRTPACSLSSKASPRAGSWGRAQPVLAATPSPQVFQGGKHGTFLISTSEWVCA